MLGGRIADSTSNVPSGRLISAWAWTPGHYERERAGYVTRLLCDEQGDLAITLRFWTGTARALTARPASSAS